MKRILSLILIFMLVFTLISCNFLKNKETNVQVTMGQAESSESQIEYIDYPIYDTQLPPENLAIFDRSYRCFEEVVDDTNDIVKATYKSSRRLQNDYEMLFEVFDSVIGDIQSGILFVTYLPVGLWGVDGGPSYSTAEIPYEEGKSYLLLLSRISYRSEDYFFRPAEDSLVIPLDEFENPDVSNSKIYEENLIKHIKNTVEMKVDDSLGFLDEIVEIAKDNPISVYENVFIDSTDRDTVLEQSPFVVVVKIDSVKSTGRARLYGDNVGEYRCNVLSVVKGDFSYQEISLDFPVKKIKIGETYTLALTARNNDPTSGYFYLSSRNSIFVQE